MNMPIVTRTIGGKKYTFARKSKRNYASMMQKVNQVVLAAAEREHRDKILNQLVMSHYRGELSTGEFRRMTTPEERKRLYREGRYMVELVEEDDGCSALDYRAIKNGEVENPFLDPRSI